MENTSKLTELTPEQESKIIEVRDFWKSFINSCKNTEIDQEKATVGINWLYESADLKTPEIIFVDSPFACQKVAANYVDKTASDYTPFSSYGNVGDYGWVAYYDYFTQIGIINNEGFNKFKDLLLCGIYDMIQLDGMCIVSSLPTKLMRNSEELLHSTTGPAVEFADGYHQHYINGRFLLSKYFDAISNKKFTMDMFINESNEEYKSTCIALMQELFGDDYIVEFFRQNLNEVDTYVDKKSAEYLKGTTGGMNVGVYTLFKGNINNEEIAYVRCFCPSTDRMFFLGVSEEHNKAKDAIASLYRIPSKLKPHIDYISRQGERFSTILTAEGMDLIKNMTEQEIANNVTIDGDTYFDLIKYEY